MKKHFFFVATVVAMALTLSSCKQQQQLAGGTSSTPQKNNGGVWGQAIELSDCEKLQEEDPMLRTMGQGVSFDYSEAKKYAEQRARESFASAISSAVVSASEISGFDYTMFSSDGKSGSQVSDQNRKRNELGSSVADEVVKNTVVIKTCPFKQDDGQFVVFVTIEYKNGFGALVTDMTSQTKKKISQQVSDEDRVKIDMEVEKYQDRVREELERRRQQQQK